MLSASEVSFSRWGAIQIYLPLHLPLHRNVTSPLHGCRSAVQHGVSAGVPHPRSTLLPRVHEDPGRPLPDHAGRHQVIRRQHSTLVLVSFISVSYLLTERMLNVDQ